MGLTYLRRVDDYRPYEDLFNGGFFPETPCRGSSGRRPYKSGDRRPAEQT
jgi:hypothetical protein